MTWVEFNNNPAGRRVGDCVVRAVSLALETDWDTAYAQVASKGFSLKDMPSSNSVWGAVLKENGYSRAVIPDTCPNCYTVEKFCDDHPKGKYILVFNEHTACIEDSKLYDAWDSSLEIPMFYWYMK